MNFFIRYSRFMNKKYSYTDNNSRFNILISDERLLKDRSVWDKQADVANYYLFKRIHGL
jgi:hypothetical protein